LKKFLDKLIAIKYINTELKKETNMPKSRKCNFMGTAYHSVDCVIFDIAETLAQCSEEFIEKIANQVLTKKVKYTGNGMFKIIKK